MAASYEKGLEVRKAVLGKDDVENSLKAASADPFAKKLQDFVTEYCWGTVWCSDGLPRKTRSMLNIAMLTALGKPHELRLHVRGALNNGLTREELKEVLLHTAVYGGFPAARTGFREAQAVFAEMEAERTAAED